MWRIENYSRCVLATCRLRQFPRQVSDFPRFGELPSELRLQIWQQRATQPRILHYNQVAARHRKLNVGTVPPILQVSREASEEGLKSYILVDMGHHPVYMNPKVDILLWVRNNGPQCFDRYADRLLNSPILDRIQNLAISIKYWNRIATEHANNYRDYNGPLTRRSRPAHD
jgi:hypothetical protein